VNLAVQDNIYTLQNLMKAGQAGSVVQLEARHHFSEGMYARELFIPAGVCVVGALHKTRHLYTVVQGKCKVSSQFGNIDIEAPFMGETLPQTKRVIYAETDCVWVTYHPTHLTDIAEIENALLEPEKQS
jgi:hypothetical protein